METTLMIYDPPAWVMSQGGSAGYRMFDVRLRRLRQDGDHRVAAYQGQARGLGVAQRDHARRHARLRGRLREAVPRGHRGGKGGRAPSASVLAGGLWPRSYRLDVLDAGAGKYIDVLPIHYGNGSGMQEARDDLDAYGYPQVGVWETSPAPS